MNNTCQLIKGFFVRRACGRPAKFVCVTCKKQVCARCQSSNGGQTCYQCDDSHDDFNEHTYARRERLFGSTWTDSDRAELDSSQQVNDDAWDDGGDISVFDS